MIWAIPAGVFALLALLSALAPTPPGAWFDKALHLFGIGAVSARATAISLWFVSALVSAGAGFFLANYTTLSTATVVVDSAAAGLGLSLLLVWLASRRNRRGVGLMD